MGMSSAWKCRSVREREGGRSLLPSSFTPRLPIPHAGGETERNQEVPACLPADVTLHNITPLCRCGCCSPAMRHWWIHTS